MSQQIVLSFGPGDLYSGFPAVTAQLWEPDSPNPIKLIGQLPAAPIIPELYRSWQLLYTALCYRIDWHLRIEIEAAGVTNVSRTEFNQVCQQFANQMNCWLNSESFRTIDQQLRLRLSACDEIRFLIETNDALLQRLPWHLWNFFEHYPKAEIALSAVEYQRSQPSTPQKMHHKVRVLAILGDSRGIDVSRDRMFLEQLSDQAEVEFLVEPPLAQLNDQLWEHGWDILFFAGHSSSQETGSLKLNQTDWLTLDEFRYALKKAIAQGLKLVIFNSCDGLGLMQQLADLHIPNVIVMREPVPDVVAQAFLLHFLKSFSSGYSLYTSVRTARERLQTLESTFPCATWLPVMYQNPAEQPITWSSLISTASNRHHLKTVLLSSLVVTLLVMAARWLGVLQLWELKAYDHLMQLRPEEQQDSRLLVVTVTEADLQLPEQRDRKGSLSDQALEQLLNTLEPYQPRAIGLDIYRDGPVNPGRGNLAQRIRDWAGFFAICKGRDRGLNHPGIAPPPELPVPRQGFSDVITDPDQVLRRHLIAMKPEPTSPCVTPYALSAQLAFHYLEAEGITAKYTSNQELQLGNVVFKRLHNHRGGYQAADTWGYQTLLNYRSHRSPLDVAPTVTLTEVLRGSLKPEDVRGKIVLIGVTAQSFHDYLLTPYRSEQGTYQEVPGVIVQAQMVSQIVSAVKDGRSLSGVWPMWGDVVWVWGWSAIAGVLVWHWWIAKRSRHSSVDQSQGRFKPQSPIYLVVITSAALGVLYGVCLGFFIHGNWVPLVPSALALIATSGSVIVYSLSQTRLN